MALGVSTQMTRGEISFDYLQEKQILILRIANINALFKYISKTGVWNA